MQLQTQLMNLVIYRPSLDCQDSLAKSLLVGNILDHDLQDSRLRKTRWDGIHGITEYLG